MKILWRCFIDFFWHVHAQKEYGDRKNIKNELKFRLTDAEYTDLTEAIARSLRMHAKDIRSVIGRFESGMQEKYSKKHEIQKELAAIESERAAFNRGAHEMPFLPSGLGLAIGAQAIPDAMMRNWFKCPDGHFWYKTPDLVISPPPYDGTTSYLEDFVHAPIPGSVEEVKQYIYVLYRQPDGRFQWKGEWLSEFPRPGQLDQDDMVAWDNYLNSEGTQEFLHEVIRRCERQAQLNRYNTGAALLVVKGDV